MKNEKRNTTKTELKFIRVSRRIETKKRKMDIDKLTIIDKKIYAKDGIRLIDAITEICPGIAIKLVQILLNLTDK